MNPSLTITLVFAASLALVVGHAVRMGWMAYRSQHAAPPLEAALPGGDAKRSVHGEVKPIPGSAVGAALPGGSNAQRVIAEHKPSTTVKTS